MACTYIGVLEIIVLALIGGRLVVVVGERLLVCTSMGLNLVSGLGANILAPMWRRANSHLSGKLSHFRPLACCMVARRSRCIVGATTASPRQTPNRKLFHNLIRAPPHHPRIDFPPTHRLSSRHLSQSSRSASRDLGLQLGQLQPQHYPAMLGDTC